MIVKNLLAVGLIATTATVASAADEAKGNWKINGKLRLDAVQKSTETKPQDGVKTTAKSSDMALNRAQFTLTGEAATGDSLVLKYYADENHLENAYIAHKFADNIVAMIGRVDTLAMSWENDYSSTDQYLTSLAGVYAPDESEGVTVAATFGEHTVSIQAVQGVKKVVPETIALGAENYEVGLVEHDDSDYKSFNNGGGLTAAVQYRGNIMNMLRPIVTYTSVRTAGTRLDGTDNATYANGYQNILGLGVQVETAGLVADLEYDTVKILKKKYEGEAPAGNKDADVNSMILQAKYALGMTTPFLKYTNDTAKYGQEGNAGDVTSMGLAVGVEHKLDAVCRLHAVYFSRASEVKVNSSDKTKINTAGFNLGVTAAL